MSEPTLTGTPAKEILKAMMILFAGMATGFFIFLLIAVFVGQGPGILQSAWRGYLFAGKLIGGALSMVCLFWARVGFRKSVEAAKDSLNPLNDKLTQYRNALIRYLALCEFPGIANIVLFVITGDFAFLVFAAVFLGFMLGVAPIKRRVIAALELGPMEQIELA